MAKSTNGTSKKVGFSMSRATGPGQYEKVYDVNQATGINVHRNSAPAKTFKAEVDRLASKLKGFVLHESSNKDRALLVRQRPMTADQIIEQFEENEAPF